MVLVTWSGLASHPKDFCRSQKVSDHHYGGPNDLQARHHCCWPMPQGWNVEDKFNILGDVTISEVRVLAGASWWTLTSSRALNVERFQNTSCQVRVPVGYSCSVTQTPHYHPPIHPNVKASVVVTYTWKHPWPADLTIFKHLGQAEAAQLNCGSEEKKLSSDSFFLSSRYKPVLCSWMQFKNFRRFDSLHEYVWTWSQPPLLPGNNFSKDLDCCTNLQPKKKKNPKKATKTQGSLTLAHLPPRLPSKVNDCQEAEVHSAIQGAWNLLLGQIKKISLDSSSGTTGDKHNPHRKHFLSDFFLAPSSCPPPVSQFIFSKLLVSFPQEPQTLQMAPVKKTILWLHSPDSRNLQATYFKDYVKTKCPKRPATIFLILIYAGSSFVLVLSE